MYIILGVQFISLPSSSLDLIVLSEKWKMQQRAQFNIQIAHFLQTTVTEAKSVSVSFLLENPRLIHYWHLLFRISLFSLLSLCQSVR